MTALALVTGTIFRAPERRTSKTGKSFVTSTVKAGSGDEVQWWRIVTFSDSAGDALMALRDGDAASVQGVLKVERYEKNGEMRVGLSIMASAVLPLRAEKKKPAADRSTPSRSARHPERSPERHPLDRYGGGGGDAAFDDEIPF